MGSDIQRAFYNGWKSIHGLMFQTVDNSLGFTIDIYGPSSLRRNDLRLFRASNINDRMRNAGNWIVFGDSAYKDYIVTVKVINLEKMRSIMR